MFALLPAVALDPGGSWTTSVLPGVIAFTMTAVAAARGEGSTIGVPPEVVAFALAAAATAAALSLGGGGKLVTSQLCEERVGSDETLVKCQR